MQHASKHPQFAQYELTLIECAVNLNGSESSLLLIRAENSSRLRKGQHGSCFAPIDNTLEMFFARPAGLCLWCSVY